MSTLTPKQKTALFFVRQHLSLFQEPVTLRALAGRMKVSKTTAWEHVKALERIGMVRAVGKRNATKYIPVNTCPTCGHELTEGARP